VKQWHLDLRGILDKMIIWQKKAELATSG